MLIRGPGTSFLLEICFAQSTEKQTSQSFVLLSDLAYNSDTKFVGDKSASSFLYKTAGIC